MCQPDKHAFNHPPLRFHAPTAAANKPIEVHDGCANNKFVTKVTVVPTKNGWINNNDRNKTIVAINIEMKVFRKNTDKNNNKLLVWIISFSINLLMEKEIVSTNAFIMKTNNIKNTE